MPALLLFASLSLIHFCSLSFVFFFNFIVEDVTLETVQIDWVYTVNY